MCQTFVRESLNWGQKKATESLCKYLCSYQVKQMWAFITGRHDVMWLHEHVPSLNEARPFSAAHSQTAQHFSNSANLGASFVNSQWFCVSHGFVWKKARANNVETRQCWRFYALVSLHTLHTQGDPGAEVKSVANFVVGV